MPDAEEEVVDTPEEEAVPELTEEERAALEAFEDVDDNDGDEWEDAEEEVEGEEPEKPVEEPVVEEEPAAETPSEEPEKPSPSAVAPTEAPVAKIGDVAFGAFRYQQVPADAEANAGVFFVSDGEYSFFIDKNGRPFLDPKQTYPYGELRAFERAETAYENAAFVATEKHAETVKGAVAEELPKTATYLAGVYEKQGVEGGKDIADAVVAKAGDILEKAIEEEAVLIARQTPTMTLDRARVLARASVNGGHYQNAVLRAENEVLRERLSGKKPTPATKEKPVPTDGNRPPARAVPPAVGSSAAASRGGAVAVAERSLDTSDPMVNTLAKVFGSDYAAKAIKERAAAPRRSARGGNDDE